MSADAKPTKRTVTIRDDLDEWLRAEWFIGTPMSSFVTVRVDDERVLALDTIEVPQAARALAAVLDEAADSATVRELGGFERVWFTANSGFVTLMKEVAGVPEAGEMVVLTADEAHELLGAFETAADELDAEDSPYA